MPVAKLWEILNSSNEVVATYRRITKDQALRAFLDDQAATAATFRRSQPIKPDKFTVRLKALPEFKGF